MNMTQDWVPGLNCAAPSPAYDIVEKMSATRLRFQLQCLRNCRFRCNFLFDISVWTSAQKLSQFTL